MDARHLTDVADALADTPSDGEGVVIRMMLANCVQLAFRIDDDLALRLAAELTARIGRAN